MTTIPDSWWELPSYLAGELVPMDRYRHRERAVISDPSWETGQNAEVRNFPQGRRPKPRQLTPPTRSIVEPSRELPEMEPYHPPAELYNQADLDALHAAGFESHSPGVWHRYMDRKPDESDEAEYRNPADVPGHFIAFDPRYRRDKDGPRTPWSLSRDLDFGGAYTSHRDLASALAQADAEREAYRMPPHQARTYLGLTAGYAALAASLDAEDEAFERAMRARQRDWWED